MKFGPPPAADGIPDIQAVGQVYQVEDGTVVFQAVFAGIGTAPSSWFLIYDDLEEFKYEARGIMADYEAEVGVVRAGVVYRYSGAKDGQGYFITRQLYVGMMRQLLEKMGENLSLH